MSRSKIDFQKWTRGLSHSSRLRLAKQLRAVIYDSKNVPCADCRSQYVQGFGSRMTFDHLDGATKSFDIGSIGVNEQGELGYRLVHMSALRQEIAKCEVVCVRCHRKREAKRIALRLEAKQWLSAFENFGLVLRSAWLLVLRDIPKPAPPPPAEPTFEQLWKSAISNLIYRITRSFFGPVFREYQPNASDAYIVGRALRAVSFATERP